MVKYNAGKCLTSDGTAILTRTDQILDLGSTRVGRFSHFVQFFKLRPSSCIPALDGFLLIRSDLIIDFIRNDGMSHLEESEFVLAAGNELIRVSKHQNNDCSNCLIDNEKIFNVEHTTNEEFMQVKSNL